MFPFQRDWDGRAYLIYSFRFPFLHLGPAFSDIPPAHGLSYSFLESDLLFFLFFFNSISIFFSNQNYGEEYCA